MATCPRCKEDMPILSKICPTCGYVEEGNGDDGVMSPAEVVTVLERILHAIKDIPRPSFARGMAQLSFVIMPILAVFSLVVALMSQAGMFWIAFIVFAIWSIVAILRKSKGKLGNDPFNRQFAEYKNDYQYFERKAARDFGKNREIASLLEEISGQIASIEKQRKAAGRRNLAIWMIILVVIVGLGGLSIVAVNNVVNDPANLPPTEQVSAYAATGEWQKAAEAYKSLDPESAEAIGARSEIVAAILASGDRAAAEEFFLSSCMGRIQDYECAAQIVSSYKAAGQGEQATAFIGRCKGMRYRSDINKLKNLL